MNRPISPASPSTSPWIDVWQTSPWLKWVLASAWISIIAIVAFLWQLGSIGLVDETEPLFAESARQMTVTGDWLTPYFNGATRFDKPPLIYWLMAIAYHAVGVNEWAARLPSAVAAIAMTLMGFYTLQQFASFSPSNNGHTLSKNESTSHCNWLAALIGSGAMALNLQTIAWGRSGVSDMLLTGCMSIALLAFFWGYAQPQYPQKQRWGYLGFYVFTALAVLTKGPVGIVIPGLILVVFLLYVGQLKSVLKEIQLFWGSVIFLLMTVPWYVLIMLTHGRTYINDFFGYHNVERFTSVVNNHSAPWYFYFLVVLLGFIPWSVYLPIAVAHSQFWRRQYWQQQPRHHHLGVLAVIWFLVIFIFFTMAITKLPSYTLPLLPAASILVALVWSQQMAYPSLSKAMRLTHGFNLLFLGILAWAVFNGGQWLGNDPVMPELPILMQQSTLLVVGGIIWSLGAIASVILMAIRRTAWIWSSNLLTFVAFFLLTVIPTLSLMDSQRQLPLRQIATEIVQSSDITAPVVMVGFKKPSLVFYTQRPVNYIYGVNEAIAHIHNKGRLKNISARRRSSSQDAFLVGTVTELDSIPLPPQKYELVEQAGVYQLIRFHLNPDSPKT